MDAPRLPPELLVGLPPAVVGFIRALLAENAALQARVAELEARLNRNSTNSSKPPSTEVLGELRGVPRSRGQVGASERRGAAALAGPVAERHAARPGCHANMDETGWKEAGRTAWLWVAVTASFTVFRVAFSRGR